MTVSATGYDIADGVVRGRPLHAVVPRPELLIGLLPQGPRCTATGRGIGRGRVQDSPRTGGLPPRTLITGLPSKRAQRR